MADRPYFMVETGQDFLDFAAWLRSRERGFVALDTETSGHRLYDPAFHIRLLQIGSSHEAWVFPFHRFGAAALAMMEEYPGTVLIHNSAYDMAAMARHGFRLPWDHVVDTMLAMRLSEPLQSAGLKEAATRHVSENASDGEKVLKDAFRRNKWDWATVPFEFEPYTFYAAMDVILTSRLYQTEACREGVASPLWQVEMDVRAVCSEMEERGMRVDVERSREIRAELLAVSEGHREIIQTRYGLDAGSNEDVGRWLFEHPDSRHLMTKATAKGAISVDKEVLEGIIEGLADQPEAEPCDLASRILALRGNEKLANSYFGNFIDFSDANGFVHAQINTLSARTGRMSITGPALQTLPKRGSSIVRDVVLPRYDDHVLVSSDYSQIEQRLIALASGDEQLIEAFRVADSTGGDFFVEMGKIIFRDPDFQKTDKRRGITKNCMYGMSYGAGPAKLAVTAGISVAEAREAMETIMGTFPGLKRLLAEYEREAYRTGRITTMGGRTVIIPRDQSYKAVNGFVQGSAADLMKTAIVDLAQAGLAEYMVVPVHDEVLFSFPADEAEELSRVVAEVMPIRSLSMEIPAEPSKPLHTWGENS